MKNKKPNSRMLSPLWLGTIGMVFFLLMSMSLNASTTVYLKFFIEGYFDGNSGMVPVRMNQTCPPPNSSTVTALVTVELHEIISPYSIVASTEATLMTNGLCTATFAGTFTGSYFIAIKHCNMLETWSALPVNLSLLTPALPYDFTTSLSMAYDDFPDPDPIPCMKQISNSPLRYAFFSGDVDQDGNIGLPDLVAIENAIMSFSYGCNCEDINGDGNSDLLDFPIPEENIFQWMKRPY